MKPIQFLLLAGLQVYRWVLSPLKTALFGPLGRCRFQPSCSEYALDAIRLHGSWRGGWLALRRLLRCHPWGGCGYDPVPGRSEGCPDEASRESGTDVQRTSSPPNRSVRHLAAEAEWQLRPLPPA